MTTIRNMERADRETVMGMVETFYTSPGVLHPIPASNFSEVYDELCGGGSRRLRGLLIEVDGEAAGYCQLTFSYSTEAGGTVVWAEELFIRPEFRGLGLGSAVFEFLRAEYSGRAKRIRLEVAPDNTRAIALYERLGYEKLPYVQMKLEDF